MNLEREIKLRARADFRLPDLNVDGVHVASSSEERYVTTYLDTRDHRLRRWGVSLRHRTGEGWTIKLPAAEDGAAVARAEHTFPGNEPRHVPREALDLVAAYLRRDRPRPVATLRTHRRSIHVADDAGTAVATVTDDAVVVERVGDRRSPSRWLRRDRFARRDRAFREVEVELGRGVAAARIAAIVEALRSAGAGPVDPTTKLERALGERSPGPEILLHDAGEGATVAEIVRAAIARSTIRLIEHDPGVRLGDDPEAVHQARVATRRLRSDLRTFRQVLDRSWAEDLRSDLRTVATAFGDVRDADVMLERLRSRQPQLGPHDGRALERLLSFLEGRRSEARMRLLRTLRGRRYLTLLDRLVDAARDPRVLDDVAGVGAREELAAVMRRQWKKARRAVAVAREAPTDVALHRARIRVKRARYAAEALVPAFGKDAKRFASAAAALQDVLGQHQDSVVANAFLREAGARSIAEAFVAGELAMLEAHARREARAAWPEAWEALDHRRLRFWT